MDTVRLIERVGGIGLWKWDMPSGEMEWSPGFWNLLDLPQTSVTPSFRHLVGMMHPDDRASNSEIESLALKGLPEESRDEATDALLLGLRRITELADDTSRGARVAMLDRLAETMRPERSSDLQYYMADFDDEVIAAATRAFMTLIPVEPAPIFERRRRYPYQPVEAALKALPGTALIQLDEGVVTLRFLSDVAPVTVARFVEMAIAGKYDDTIFHSVAHNTYALGGGSPGANDYSSPATRFLRTEAGPQARHIRGAVGMWNHGADSGDGQFFIDMVDLPRLDHEFTVFAYVTGGMELVDRLLSGAKIVRVMVK